MPTVTFKLLNGKEVKVTKEGVTERDLIDAVLYHGTDFYDDLGQYYCTWMVCGVVTFATQSAGCEIAGGLQSTPLLMFHGDSDSILPLEASEVVRAIAGTGDLHVMHGDDHLLAKSHDVMFSTTMEWLNTVFAGAAS